MTAASVFMIGSADNVIDGFRVVYALILLGLVIAIILAPLFIWQWTSRTCKAVREVRDLLEIIRRDLLKSSSKNQENMFNIAQGVAAIGEAMVSGADEGR